MSDYTHEGCWNWYPDHWALAPKTQAKRATKRRREEEEFIFLVE